MTRTLFAALAATLALAAPASAADAKYGLVHGCYSLAANGATVAKTGSGYATGGGAAEVFRMQATALGRYMLYGKAKDFLGVSGGDVVTVAEPGPAADFAVDDAAGGAFTLRSGDKGVVVGEGGKLALGATATPLTFTPAEGCPEYPEAEVNATGDPYTGPTSYGGVKGYIDAHMHMMGFEFLGGNVHCGRPWSPYGVTVALKGCETTATPDTLLTESVLTGGDPSFDQKGWPTFHDWPEHHRLTHEQSYYKWLERSWRAGQRVFVNLFVENHALCTVYPVKRNSCNEMDSVRLQAKDLRALEDYIDAQNGGPGKGWFRIVADPFQARRVINAGKLAVVPGIEVSNLFDCSPRNDGQSVCTPEDVDKRLDAVYNDLGVRDMELINKFDNGFGGVAGDSGSVGLVVNSANKYETGRFWDLETCKGPKEESDHEQMTLPTGGRDELFSAFSTAIPGGATPVYPEPPHCNKLGLTALGDHLVRRMIEKRMIIDPDHLSVVARKQLLTLVESQKYSGIVSSHSWSTSDAYPRILRSGGVVSPYAGDSKGFVEAWKRLRSERDKRYFWGIGWGADMNGFGGQGGPRNGKDKVQYPFKAGFGDVTLDRQKTGERTFDINTDGVAQYGLYPDWVEDLRVQAGDRIVKDLSRGAEAYLEMWERAVGVAPSDRCRQRNLGFRADHVGLLILGAPAEDVLRGAGQPVARGGRAWRWCVRGPGRKGDTYGLFDAAGRLAFVASTGPKHAIRRVKRGDPASDVPAKARRAGAGLFTERASRGTRFVYGIRKGKVRFVGVGTNATTSRAALRRTLRRARVRT